MNFTTNIHVALDLGSDTLKVVFAYKLYGEERWGKIVPDGTSLMALPAVAYFNQDKNAWYFADEVTEQQSNSYLTVVKIKQLLTLLQRKSSLTESVYNSNVKYYNSGNHFPKFIFPLETKTESDFSKLIEQNKTFEVSKTTPKSVCEQYFKYIGKLVERRIKCIADQLNSDYTLQLSLVYPPNIGQEFISELKRIVLNGFDKRWKIHTVLSMTKALSIYAKQRGIISEGQSALVFNVGEDKTFVAKTNIQRSGVSIDGLEGHSSPIDLGGNDIDNAVANFLERRMEDRETMGSPSAGSDGHVYERGLLTKQYLFLKEIKMAKIFFGMYGKEDSLFKDGVPINVIRDLNIRLKLTHDEFANCVGVDVNGKILEDSFAEKLYRYIVNELDKNINRNVEHVFITGGVVETYRLVEAIKAKMGGRKRKVAVGTFEGTDRQYDSEDSFAIFAHEDAVYAPAVGCALAALNNIKVATLTSLTYGTDIYLGEGNNRRCIFSLLVDKGYEISENGECVHYKYNVPPCLSGSLLIFSMSLTKRELERQMYKDEGLRYESTGLFLFDNSGKTKSYERMLEKKIDFRRRNTEKEAAVMFYHNDTRVQLLSVFDRLTGSERRFNFEAGIQFDANGIAKPFVGKSEEANSGVRVKIRYLPEKSSDLTGETYVWANDIELRAQDFTIKIEGAD